GGGAEEVAGDALEVVADGGVGLGGVGGEEAVGDPEGDLVGAEGQGGLVCKAGGGGGGVADDGGGAVGEGGGEGLLALVHEAGAAAGAVEEDVGLVGDQDGAGAVLDVVVVGDVDH